MDKTAVFCYNFKCCNTTCGGCSLNTLYLQCIGLSILKIFLFYLEGRKDIMKQRTALIGHPLGHTLSPFIHKRLYSLQNLEHSYEVLDIPYILESIEKLRTLDAFNVTIPYKEKIIPYLDRIDTKAKIFGSVNTVCIKNGIMTGYTTDGAGVMAAFEKNGISLNGNVLILGTGGAARAIAFEIAYVCKDANIRIICRNSSTEKAKSIKYGINAISCCEIDIMTYDELQTYADNESPHFDVLVNATSVGMYPETKACPVSDKVISCCNTVFDAVYNPTNTELLKLAKENSKNVIYGIDMLVYQAVAAHKIWNDADFRDSDIKKLIYDTKEELSRLFSGRG